MPVVAEFGVSGYLFLILHLKDKTLSSAMVDKVFPHEFKISTGLINGFLLLLTSAALLNLFYEEESPCSAAFIMTISCIHPSA